VYNILTKLTIYLVLGLVLDGLGLGWSSVGFWSILALFACLETIARWDGVQVGTTQGIANYLKMTQQQQEQIKQMIRRWEQR